MSKASDASKGSRASDASEASHAIAKRELGGEVPGSPCESRGRSQFARGCYGTWGPWGGGEGSKPVLVLKKDKGLLAPDLTRPWAFGLAS